ncbi:MAG: hypothetical protein KDD15_14790, partial [Lewinella sp.]|nr:hypothetical protein [Lewinella sp.]
MRFFLHLISCLLLLTFISCRRNTAEVTHNHLGEVHFTAQGLPEAQAYFQKGLLLLHSFEYDDSRLAFLQAQEEDPN